MATKEEREELVVLVKPADQKEAVYLSEVGPLRFVEGRATVPLSVAQKLADENRGWWIESAAKLTNRTTKEEEA